MQSENRMFDDLMKVVSGAAGTLAGVGREAEATARSRAREWIGGLDFVSRDEFEVDALRARIDAIEAASRSGLSTTSPLGVDDTLA
jgi:BMFP domain-containing protein YqiC